MQTFPARQTRPAAPAEEACLAQLVVAHREHDPFTKRAAQLANTDVCALKSGWIAQPNEGGIAGIIAVCDDPIGSVRLADELFDQAIICEWIPAPNKVAVHSDEQTKEWV